MSRRSGFEGLEAFVAERGTPLLATATLLAGGREEGQDLLQEGLERLMRNWQRVDGDPEGYLRRTLYHLAVDRWRRWSRWSQVRLSVASQVPDGSEQVALRAALVASLARLPAKQRAAVVLRYWEQLSESEVADALGCSVGTVKSNTSRGMARLRELTAGWLDEEETTYVGVVR
ncbi:MAG: SigE family RNA polymerase sigma factor [Kineosporiaceae bacterium]